MKPTIRKRALTLAAQQPAGSPLRKAILAVTAPRVADNSYSLDASCRDLLFDAARDGGLAAADVSSPGPGIYILTISEDVENPSEPGDYHLVEYRITLSFLTGAATVHSGKTKYHSGKVPLPVLWNQGLGSVLRKLSQHVPVPSFQQEDSPSLQDSMPWAYRER